MLMPAPPPTTAPTEALHLPCDHGAQLHLTPSPNGLVLQVTTTTHASAVDRLNAEAARLLRDYLCRILGHPGDLQ